MKKRHITIPLFIPHQGCKNKCIFCNQWTVSNTQKPPGTQDIDETIKKYLSTVTKDDYVELAFFGGSFTGLHKETQESLLKHVQKYISMGTIRSIRLSTRPDYIDNENLELLKNYNVNTIELGVQSFHNNILERSRRGHTAEDAFQAIELIKNFAFNFVIQLMPGLPMDTPEQSIQSAHIAAELYPNAIRIYPAIVLKDTELERLYLQKLYTPLSLEEAIDITKSMYLIFKNRSIPVIRMGLHPMDAVQESSIIAGPYHTSFGFLVKSRARRDMIHDKVSLFLKTHPVTSKKIVIHIPHKKKEEYIGNNKENIKYIKNIFKLNDVEYRISKDNRLKIDNTI